MARAATDPGLREELVRGAHALSRLGLVTSFGHVSARVGEASFLITPLGPLGRLADAAACREVDLTATELPPGVPREAWIHSEIYRARSDVGGICRAQPVGPAVMAAVGVAIVPLHGQGAFLGPQVPVFDDPSLVRDPALARAVAAVLGSAPAIVLRGNGAVTVGATTGEAVARMVVLETSAQMNIQAAAVGGTPRPLSDDEQATWRGVATEILGRIWDDVRERRGPSQEGGAG
jgi:HCOMODA/2-hydroxy-3-carboxy-muconic semialdehyde decarboxylase